MFSYTPNIMHLCIKIDAKTEHTQEILSKLYTTIAPTHKEEGCLSYKILRNGNSICVTGEWKNEMSLNLHLMLQFHIDLFEVVLPPLSNKIEVASYLEVEPPLTVLSLG